MRPVSGDVSCCDSDLIFLVLIVVVAAPMLLFPLRETPHRVACHNVCESRGTGQGL